MSIWLIYNSLHLLIQNCQSLPHHTHTHPISLGNHKSLINRHFSKEDIQMIHRHMKRCSISLIIWEIEIKTTVRYHLGSVRIVIIKKCTNKKWWRECGEKATLLRCWMECELVQPLWRTVWKFLKKTKNRVTTSSHSWVCIQTKLILKCTHTPIFREALSTITNTQKQQSENFLK